MLRYLRYWFCMLSFCHGIFAVSECRLLLCQCFSRTGREGEFSRLILGQRLQECKMYRVQNAHVNWTSRHKKKLQKTQSTFKTCEPDIGMTCGESSFLHFSVRSVSSTSAVESYFHWSSWVATLLQWTWCSTAICPNGTSTGAPKDLESLHVQLPQSSHRILCLVAFDVDW